MSGDTVVWSNEMPTEGQFIALWVVDGVPWSNVFRFNGKGRLEAYDKEEDEWVLKSKSNLLKGTLYGTTPEKAYKFKVTMSECVSKQEYIHVRAATEEEATKKAWKFDGWGGFENIHIISVERILT